MDKKKIIMDQGLIGKAVQKEPIQNTKSDDNASSGLSSANKSSLPSAKGPTRASYVGGSSMMNFMNVEGAKGP